MILPSYGTSSFHWPGEIETELHGLSCRAETRETNIILQKQRNKINRYDYRCHKYLASQFLSLAKAPVVRTFFFFPLF